ncbi:LacI family DNA-binding transcriptional regulator [Lactobacillus sp. ESL0785]|uniref:LacI family DNA-binding transcriptional regulator n=1 Tax=Lactobacillus sp. ESL0785 TaxID=2983232 RepID=UPI0023F938A3|nr:LacI family DNA-binding transcriptional regulator [Lactobacillus sp. ESL0785]WEV70898.1 LacI family DNA-binding transcriptional regulator [Lactobacillus sp. ESL0785]
MKRTQHKKATIKDVASLANVSVASVSRYLNGKSSGRLSPIKAQAIKRAIKLLNYIPNAAARQMVTNQSRMIAVVVANIDDYFSTEMFKGASNILKVKGYQAFLLDTNADQAQETDLVTTVSSKYFDGLLFQPLSSNLDIIEKEIVHDIPTVILDRQLPTTRWPQVLTNNFAVSKRATSYFLQLGYTDILVLSSKISIASTRKDRYKGICSLIDEKHIFPLEIDEEEYNYSAIEKQIESFLQNQRKNKKKTLIFGLKERWLLEFMPSLYAKGYLDNKYVTVTGFVDTKTGKALFPGSKLISQQPYLMGASAAEILLNKLSAKGTDNEQIIKPLIIPANF